MNIKQQYSTYYFKNDEVLYISKPSNLHFSTKEDSTPWFGVAGKILHRIDGPAVEFQSGFKAYYLHGVRHRIDGPAIIHPQINKNFYFLFGIKYNKKEFKNQLKNIRDIIALNLINQDPTLRKVAEDSYKLLNPLQKSIK